MSRHRPAIAVHALNNALAYAGAIFALGFVLGTVRTLWLAPQVGALAAVPIEVPVMPGWVWGRSLGVKWRVIVTP